MATSLTGRLVSGEESKPSDTFRQEHAEIRKHLDHIYQAVGTLPKEPPAKQRKTMTEAVSFLKEHIRPHAEWEEKVLYAAVDKRAGIGTYLFTSTMRYDHKVVGRWIAELEKLASAKSPEPNRFERLTDRLLGLLDAHFEKEEEVLLPILDKAMSKQEFDQEIMSKH